MPSPKTTAVEANRKKPIIYRDSQFMLWKVRWEHGGEVPMALSGMYSSIDLAEVAVAKYLEARG